MPGPEVLPLGHTYYHESVKGRSKIYGVPGPGLRTGGLKIFLAVKKEGQKFFLTRETWGLVLFSLKKRGGHYLYFLIKNGAATFFTFQVLKGITFFANNSEPWQSMPLSISEN